MSVDFKPPIRTARGPSVRLREALVELAGEHAQMTRQSERAWASITFEGARHTFELAFAGHVAVADGEAFIAELPDHEFSVPGHLVAEATVVAVDHSLVPEPRMTVTCELLLLKDA